MDFQQQSIEMKMKVGSDYSRHMSCVIDHLAKFTSSVFVFLNSKSFMDNIASSIKGKVDKHLTVSPPLLPSLPP